MVYFTMAVRKLANGKWEADVTVGFKPDGTPDRRRRVRRTKREATAAERELLIVKDPRLVSGHILLDDFINDIFWKEKTLRPSTVQGYERDIKLRISPYLGSMFMDEIRRSDVQRMISACSSRKVATNARETLSSILGFAVDHEMLPSNVAGLRYSFPKATLRDPDADGVWLTSFNQHREFFETLRKAGCPEALWRIAVIGLSLGLRKGEMLALEWNDINFAARTARIRQTYVSGKGGAYSDDPKTEASYRDVPIPGFAFEELSKWDRSTTWVVVGYKGRKMSPSTAKTWFQKFYDAHPTIKRVTMYAMRHSFATSCIRAGIDVALVSKWLGHKDVSTTYNRYVKPLLADLQDEVSTIDAAFAS